MGLSIVLFSLMIYSVSGQRLRDGYTIDARSAYDQDLYDSVLDSQLCQQQLDYLQNSSLRWQFIDSSGKIPSGMLSGNVNDLGDYFQCLGINQLIDDLEFQGKYCTITVPLEQDPFDIPEFPDLPDITWPGSDNAVVVAQQYEMLRRYALGVSGLGDPVENRVFPLLITATSGATLGVCVPKVCTAREAINYFQDRIPFVNFTYNEYYCRLPNDKPYSGADYTAMAIFGMLACIIVLSTLYDLYYCFVIKDPMSANIVYRCFSVYTNTRRFLTFNSPAGALECVDGIRAISMMWVIVGHTYSFTLVGFIHNLDDTLTWMTAFSSTWINSAPMTVDTFFMLSGILAVYTTVGKISKRRFIRSLHLFYINRLLRMFPLLATVVLLQASLFNHVSDGPFWINMSQQAENCRTWWWAALLHVQNYVNQLEICLPQSWYLSVDVQLYFVCPLVMVWLFGAQLHAWAALCGIVLLSLVSSSVYSFKYNFSAALSNPARITEFNDYVLTYYMNTLTRSPPFFVGMAYGYLLHLYRSKRIRITKLNVCILWLLSAAMMLFCVFSIYPVMQPTHSAQMLDNFLNAYMRAIWACGLGWVIFACVQGYGGPVNWFLSLTMWKLPARLSFAMYLIHVPIIMIANGSWVKTHYFTEGDNIYRFFSDFGLSFVAAFVLCIAIDAPFSTLQKLLNGGGKKQPLKPRTESREIIVEDPVILKTSL